MYPFQHLKTNLSSSHADLEISAEFSVGTSTLGLATFWRGITQSLVALVAGPLTCRWNRIHLLTLGCLLLGSATALVGASDSSSMLLLSRAFNGLGIGLVIPVAFALVADLAADELRGRAFGALFFCWNVGGAAGGYFATTIAASPSLAGGVRGWRLACYYLAVISGLMAVLLLAFARDPRPALRKAPSCSLRTTASEAWQVLRVPSFVIILLQGAVGTAPWYSMSFLTLYFERCGLSHPAAALARSLLDVGSAVGTLIGGVLNDWASRVSPSHGRVVVAQISVGSGIPLFLIIFYAIPAQSMGSVLLVAGALITWCQGVNNTIMAEVTRPQLRTTIYGLDRMLEGLLAPLGGFVVGLLAEKQEGVVAAQEGNRCTGDTASTASARAAAGNQMGNLWLCAGSGGENSKDALRNALALAMCIPWTLCFVAYSWLHCTYPGDKHRTAVASAAGDADIDGDAIELRDNDHAAKHQEHPCTSCNAASSTSACKASTTREYTREHHRTTAPAVEPRSTKLAHQPSREVRGESRFSHPAPS